MAASIGAGSARSVGLALALVALAGFVDAIAFLALQGLFVSFMSGNTTQLAAQIASEGIGAGAAPAAVIGAFVIGVGTGTALLELRPRFAAAGILTTETALMLTTAIATREGVTVVHLLPLAFAMGLQNNLRQSAWGTKLGSTFVTGALVSAGEGLARHLLGRGNAGAWLPHAASWLALVVGALAGGLIYVAAGMGIALAGPIALTALLAIAAARSAIRAPAAEAARKTPE